MKLALHILGKYPCISNMFGEDEVHLFLQLKMVFVRNGTGNVDQNKNKKKMPQKTQTTKIEIHKKQYNL